MKLVCPSCGLREARVSRPRGLGGYLKSLFGVSALRCPRCSKRWETSAWANGAWKYARCPRCYRQELTKWTMQYYNPTRWIRFLLRVGAKPLRCPACRCNFAAFKPRKGHFSWRHEIRTEAAPRTPNQESALVSGQTPPDEESGDQMP